MNHWIIVPVILPAVLAPLIGFVMRHDLRLARIMSVAGVVAQLAVAIALVVMAIGNPPEAYFLGNWPAPFGIVLVLDRFAAMMVALTVALALCVLVYAIATGWDGRGRHFHALYQFQLMGITGAFLTGDAFNLFVFFEVLLIASYGLMIHSGGKERLQVGLQYVVMNLAGSTLFLFALGTIYAVTGTLNIADLARILPTIPPEEAALVRVAAMLLMMVFAIKAALFPVQFWLPATYAAAPGPVAALFAIMTKVGAYALIRFNTVIFGPEVAATGSLPADMLFWSGVVTLAIGAVGVMGARRFGSVIAFSVLASMGTILVAAGMMSPDAMAAALYYMVHSTLAAAILFLVADLVSERRGQLGGRMVAGPALPQAGLIAALFFAGAIAMAGMPPLSGFLGKLWILSTVQGDAGWQTAWTAILAGSFLTILGFARAGSLIFWKPAEAGAPPDPSAPGVPAWAVAAVLSLVALTATLTVLAGPAGDYVAAVSAELFDPGAYVAAVLPDPAE